VLGGNLNDSKISIKSTNSNSRNKQEGTVIDMSVIIDYLNSNEENKNILMKLDVKGINQFLFTK